MKITGWLRRLWGKYGPGRHLQIIEGDTLPSELPSRDLILTRDNGDDWSVGMRCPCGCGDSIELMILKEARPRWDIKVNKAGQPSLYPSVFRKSGCKSHFWVRQGKILWCE